MATEISLALFNNVPSRSIANSSIDMPAQHTAPGGQYNSGRPAKGPNDSYSRRGGNMVRWAGPIIL